MLNSNFDSHDFENRKSKILQSGNEPEFEFSLQRLKHKKSLRRKLRHTSAIFRFVPLLLNWAFKMMLIALHQTNLTLTIPFGTGVPSTQKMYAITTIYLEIIKNASRDLPLKLKCAFNAGVKKFWVKFLIGYEPEMTSETSLY